MQRLIVIMIHVPTCFLSEVVETDSFGVHEVIFVLIFATQAFRTFELFSPFKTRVFSRFIWKIAHKL